MTYGLADDPVGALARMVARVERAASDGESIIVLRHISPGEPSAAPTLYHSVGPETLHVRPGEVETLPDDAQLVVSEPLELHYSRRRWVEVPEGSVLVLRRGEAPQTMPLADAAGSPAVTT